MTTVTEVPTLVIIDKGPVWNAARILVESSTLTNHINVSNESEWTATVEHRADDVPYELWGSGTQALWLLLCSIVSTRHTVSLYEVAARCDHLNRRAVADAVAALCR